MKRAIIPLALVMMAAAPLRAEAALPADPLGSPMWEAHAKLLFGDAPVRFDPRVKVDFPMIAENQRSFPVAVDARAIPQVKRIILFADLNPIAIAIDYWPTDSDAFIATRIKLDQRTPVRGAVQLASGEWLVSGGWIDAAGGGCSAPPLSRVKGDWAEHLGEIRGAAWPIADHASRLRLNFRHPMDTGLAGSIPTYHLEELVIRDDKGRELSRMTIAASVAEDPAITLLPHVQAGAALMVEGRDTNGLDYRATLNVARQTAGLQ